MRILWLTHFVPFPATGHGALQRTHQLLLQGMAEHDVSLVGLARDDADWAKADDAIEFFRPRCASVQMLRVSGRAHKYLAAGASVAGSHAYWSNLLYSSSAAGVIQRHADKFDPEWLHLDTIFLERYRSSAPRARLAITHHNVESDLLTRRAGTTTAAGRWFLGAQAHRTRDSESRLGGSPTVNLMVSGEDGARLREIAPGADTVVVPNGVDVEFFRPTAGVQPKPGSFVFAGGMDWYPNRMAIEWFANELWPALAADNPNRTATIIGRSPPQAVIDLAARDSRVRVTGLVPDVRPLISAAAIYLCPIHVGGGTRLKILDALSMERPLISTQLGVSGLGLEDGRHYLSAETAGEFVNQARRLEGDASFGQSLARRGRTLVEDRFSWNTIGHHMNEAFRSRYTSKPH
jgi:polysaccharide biosynthesis protein PslH